MKKNILFIWIILCQKVFNKLKKVFTTVLYLIFFISDRLIRIKTDTSDKGLETYLLQQDKDKIWHPIVFMLRKITSAKLNYDIYDKELLIIVAAFQM